MPKSLEDVAFLLASYLVDQNRDKLAEVRNLLRDHSQVLERLDKQTGDLMSINEENQAKLDQLAETLTVQFAEVLDALEDLRNQPGAEALDFSRADAAVQQVADTIPDTEPEPDPEEPA
jgi:hypothetical protein